MDSRLRRSGMTVKGGECHFEPEVRNLISSYSVPRFRISNSSHPEPRAEPCPGLRSGIISESNFCAVGDFCFFSSGKRRNIKDPPSFRANQSPPLTISPYYLPSHMYLYFYSSFNLNNKEYPEFAYVVIINPF
jgi:hypothetical protein